MKDIPTKIDFQSHPDGVESWMFEQGSDLYAEAHFMLPEPLKTGENRIAIRAKVSRETTVRARRISPDGKTAFIESAEALARRMCEQAVRGGMNHYGLKKKDEPFDEAWGKFANAGYRYGQDALEQVRFGWDIARGLRPRCDNTGDVHDADQSIAGRHARALLATYAATQDSPVADERALMAWVDRFPEISDMGRLRDAWNEARASTTVSSCAYCNDTGDVHSIDGEWRGVCKCPAGQALKK